MATTGAQQGPPLAISAQYLDKLSTIAGRSFSSTREALQAILVSIAEQLGTRSSFLSQVTTFAYLWAATQRDGQQGSVGQFQQQSLGTVT